MRAFDAKQNYTVVSVLTITLENCSILVEREPLTERERRTLNGHMVHTIEMLDAPPFPRELPRIAEYATGHHERMNGSDDPRDVHAGTMKPANLLISPQRRAWTIPSAPRVRLAAKRPPRVLTLADRDAEALRFSWRRSFGYARRMTTSRPRLFLINISTAMQSFRASKGFTIQPLAPASFPSAINRERPSVVSIKPAPFDRRSACGAPCTTRCRSSPACRRR